jgi:hypothetical protein
MTKVVLAGLALSVALCAQAAAQEAPAPADNGLSAALSDCIRTNAAFVERAVDALPEAVDFLVLKVCAVEAASQERQLRAAAAAGARERLRERCAHGQASDAPRRSRDSLERGLCEAMARRDALGVDAAATAWHTAPTRARPEAAALAARLLIEQRLARSRGAR